MLESEKLILRDLILEHKTDFSDIFLQHSQWKQQQNIFLISCIKSLAAIITFPFSKQFICSYTRGSLSFEVNSCLFRTYYVLCIMIQNQSVETTLQFCTFYCNQNSNESNKNKSFLFPSTVLLIFVIHLLLHHLGETSNTTELCNSMQKPCPLGSVGKQKQEHHLRNTTLSNWYIL